jgi:hypothetical protein
MPARLSRTANPLSRSRTPPARAADHSRRLREAQENLEHGGAAIMAMIYMGHLGVTHSREALAREIQAIDASGVLTGEALQGFQVRRLFHEITAHTATAAVDSAAILYAHAVLSGVIDTLCAVSVELDPEVWAGAHAESEKAHGLLPPLSPPTGGPTWLAHAALWEKCDALLRINRRGSHRDVLREYKYSVSRLRKLDQLRQRLVEASTFERRTQDVEEKVDDLLNTAQFFINLVTRRRADESPTSRAKSRRAAQPAPPAAEPVWLQGELL